MNEQTIFLTALEKVAVDERAAWLAEACGTGTPLKQRIESLLLRHDEAKSFLENPFLAEMDVTIDGRSGTNEVDAGNNHSVLRSLGWTLDGVSRVVLRDAKETHDDRIVQPSSAEIPKHDSNSRYQLLGELAPENGFYWNTLGVAQYRNALWRDALESLNTSTKLHQETGVAVIEDLLFLTMTHWKLGNLEEARKLYDNADEWRSENTPSAQQLGFFAEAAKLLAVESETPSGAFLDDKTPPATESDSTPEYARQSQGYRF